MKANLFHACLLCSAGLLAILASLSFCDITQIFAFIFTWHSSCVCVSFFQFPLLQIYLCLLREIGIDIDVLRLTFIIPWISCNFQQISPSSLPLHIRKTPKIFISGVRLNECLFKKCFIAFVFSHNFPPLPCWTDRIL